MNLFIIYIGGSHEQSFIELHDMRFIIAHSIEDTYEELKKSWWGKQDSLHLDAWGILKYVDGYKILLENTPQIDTENKLYFVNLGGYNQKEFTELHKNIFVVAESEVDAKSKALKQIIEWDSPHKDYQFEAEKIISISDFFSNKKVYIHLDPTDVNIPFEFTCQYIPIGK